MSKKYYKQGEKLEHLKQDIKFVLESENQRFNVFMKKENYDKFSEKIKKPIIDLHNVLLRTVIDEDSLEIKTIKVLDACKNVVDFLKQNVIDDLKRDFYEEKLKLYDGLYFEFIQNNLIKAYPKHSEILNSITHEYTELRKVAIDTFDFSKYTSLTKLYNHMQDGLNDDDNWRYFTSDSLEYITHSAELLMKEVQDMFSSEFFKQENNTTRWKRVRKLIYVLKTELEFDLEKEKL